MSKNYYKRSGRWIRLFAAVAISACTAQSAPVNTDGTSSNSNNSRQSLTARDDTDKLNTILESRGHDAFGSGSDFPLGPGDLLEISVPLEGLEHREVRVSSESAITLPLVGAMNIKGMSEEQLTKELRHRLSKYMYNPPVVLFVKHYANRDVAVTGAVERPGLYPLQSGSDTLKDVISRAGGATGDAGSQVFFVPAPLNSSAANLALLNTATGHAEKQATMSIHTRRKPADPSRVTAIEPDPPGMQDPPNTLPALATLHPIAIDTKNPKLLEYLDIPARPGDVLIVPAAGEVTVGGWVKTPGAYKITPGMTALSAISAAGGPLFSSTGEILRTDSNGERISLPFNISNVQEGQQTDQLVQAGDVVMIDRSVVGAVPYTLFDVFSRFGTGMYIPVP